LGKNSPQRSWGKKKQKRFLKAGNVSEILKSVFSAHFTKKMLTVVYLKRVAAWAVLSGENWGSLLAINIEPMDAPDGFVSPTPKAAGKPKARILIHTDSQPRFSCGEHSSASGIWILSFPAVSSCLKVRRRKLSKQPGQHERLLPIQA